MPSPSRLALASVGLALLSGTLCFRIGAAGAAPSEQPRPAPVAPKIKRPTRDALLANFDPRQRTRDGEHLVTPLEAGYRGVLTLNPELNEFVSDLLADYQVPYAGFVAVEPSSGKVLAYVSHSSVDPSGKDRVLDASPPAASVFKVVTSSALLDHGVSPDTTTCYHGGFSSLLPSELEDNPKLDSACVSLASALGNSVNPVFAKLALKHLNEDKLEHYGSAFGFGEVLPFDVKPEPSRLDVPEERVEFARTAAGFWHAHMSPLHGAMIASTIANHGRMMRPYVLEQIEDESGQVISRTEPQVHRNVLERRTADLVGRMMLNTVTSGTARKTFFDEKGNPFLPGIRVAGKTGTLSKERPYRGYTWWVGFAPADAPKIAVAALVVNSPKWRIKASFVAREALRHFLVEQPKRAAKANAKVAQR